MFSCKYCEISCEIGQDGIFLCFTITCKFKVNIRQTFPIFDRFLLNPLREKCPYSEFSGSYSAQMRENTDQKNSEYIHFSRSDSVVVRFLSIRLVLGIPFSVVKQKST